MDIIIWIGILWYFIIFWTTTPKVISTSQGIFVPYRHEAKSSFGEFLWQMFWTPCWYETLYGDNESELKAISALEEEINEVEEKYNQMKRQHDTSGSFSWIAIQYKLVNALNFPLQSLLGRVSLTWNTNTWTEIWVELIVKQWNKVYSVYRSWEKSDTYLSLQEM